jgi:phosphocarrier protein
MKEIKLVIKNETGLHARPAAMVVSEAGKYKSNLTIKKGEREVNIKSILGLLSLGASKGDEITVKADGEDENQAVEAIVKMIEDLKE